MCLFYRLKSPVLLRNRDDNHVQIRTVQYINRSYTIAAHNEIERPVPL